ncbi:hypothetical protein E2320_011892 [Naja naja]|nr:hypothetical protein E2320_011892 [Naja naja]
MAFCRFFGGEVYQGHFEAGIYICSKCGYELFSSQSKFLHSSPWPAFTHPIHSDSISKYLERPGAFKLNLGRTRTNKQADNILANSTREPLVLDGKLPLQRDLELNETNSLDFSSSTIQCAPSAGKPHPRIPPGVPYARIFCSDSDVN